MRIPLRALAVTPLCAIVMLAAAPPPFGIDRGPAAAGKAPQPSATARAARRPSATAAQTAPGAPPDGTYTYELSRNGVVQGSTTVALYHRGERSSIETNEAGSFGAATANVVASFAGADYSTQTYVATYRAPFARDMPLGRVDSAREHVAFDAPTTVRYDISHTGVRATVDGVDASYVPRATLRARARFAPFVLDAPFMTSALLIPDFHRIANAAYVSWYALAFPRTLGESAPISSSAIRPASAAPHFPNTPKRAIAISIAGLGTLLYDPRNGTVYEAHFGALNVDADLVSYARTPEPAAVPSPRSIPVPASPGSRAIVVPSGNERLAGVLDLPSPAASSVPAVVLVPPGPAGDRNFDSGGPEPMFVDFAKALTARGFAVLRYDPRGAGALAKFPATWDDARDDARAAIAFAQSAPEIDPSRVFVLGYGNGADLALAAAGSGGTGHVSGVVALAPTTVKYQDCARKRGGDVSHPTLWQRSAFAHDPTTLAAEANVSLLVLQPGVGICGETADQIATYDLALRAADMTATIVVASDLSQSFDGLFDADSQANTQEFFPYRFDPSTLEAVANWIAAPNHELAPFARPAPEARRRRWPWSAPRPSPIASAAPASASS